MPRPHRKPLRLPQYDYARPGGYFATTCTCRRQCLFGAVWQRGYYDHVVRGGRDLDGIRQYIRDNPARWHGDRCNSRLTPALPSGHDASCGPHAQR